MEIAIKLSAWSRYLKVGEAVCSSIFQAFVAGVSFPDWGRDCLGRPRIHGTRYGLIFGGTQLNILVQSATRSFPDMLNRNVRRSPGNEPSSVNLS